MATFPVAAVQSDVWPLFPDADWNARPAHFERNLARACAMVDGHARSAGARLYCFSEFFLTASPAGAPAEIYRQAAIRIPGPELDQLAAVARKRRVWIAGMAYEVDEARWPGRFFNTGFILGPDGDVILKYRKHYDETCKTKPGDVLDAYLQAEGPDSLFPVVETELGKLCIQQAWDINIPEVSRCYALQGAEILLFATSEIVSKYHQYGVGGWANARRVRAYENIAYLVCANGGRFSATGRPEAWSTGHSEVIDYHGQVLATADHHGESIVTGEVDLEALRQRRTRVGMNFLAQTQASIFAEALRRARLYPAHAFADAPPASGADNARLVRDIIARLQRDGPYAPPA